MADDNEAMWLAGANQLNQSLAQIGSVADSNHARKWSEKMYNRQMADIRANWAIQNAYDSPVMQMARLRAAGLNPAMMMKGGAELSLSGSNMQQASAPSPSFAPYAPAGQFDVAALSNARLANAQSDLMAAQADSIRAKTPHEIDAIDAGISKANKELDVLSSTLQTMEQDRFLSILRNDREQKILENDSVRVLNDTKMTDAQIERFIHENELSDAQADVARSVAALNSRQLWELCQTYALRVRGIDLNNQKILSDIGFTNKQVEYYDKIIEGLGFDNITKQFDAAEAKVLMNDAGELPGGSTFARRVGYLFSQFTQFLRLFNIKK